MRLRTAFLTALALLSVSVTADRVAAQESKPRTDAQLFEKTIWPILESKCTECHRAPYKDARGRTRKPRGGLRLDGRRFLLEGGDGGPAVVPGRVERSLLHERIALDEDDPDLMPEDGPKLDDQEIEAIRAWIADGAPFGDWVGEGGLPDRPVAAATPTARETLLGGLAEGLEPLSASRRNKVVSSFGDGGVQLIELDPEGRLLRVQFASHQTTVDDRALRALDPVLDRIVELDLGRTRITDRGLAALKKAERLTTLDLSRTSIDGSGLSSLEELDSLRVLTLFGCERLRASSAKSIARIETLTRIYLGGTTWSDADLDSLRGEMPRTRVFGDPKLPSPARGGDDARGRRRR